MPLLSYNCLNKLNLYPMHIFRFQRTWFYPADLGCPRPGYQTMSTIKGTLRHSKKGEGRKMGIQGKSSEIQNIYSYSFKSPTKEGKEKKGQNKREPRSGNSSHILEIIESTTQPPKKHMLKHAHIRYHSLPQHPSHLTILEGNVQAKPLGLEFQIPQVLCKSTKFVRIGARILVTDSFSWSLFTYMYMY